MRRLHPIRIFARLVAGLFVAVLTIGIALWVASARGSEKATVTRTIEVAGTTRTYLLHIPPQYQTGKPTPLVLVLHGATESPESAERLSQMSDLSDKKGFLVAYPRGTGRIANVPTWNSGACCSYAQQHNIDDVGFLRTLIDTLSQDYSVDQKRIFVTGISNGGMMAYRLACALSDKIAAISPVEGSQDIDCRPSNPVSVIVFHGTADRLVPFNGGSTPFQMGSKRSDTPVLDTVRFWVGKDGCSATPERKESSEVIASIYSACKEGTGVALYAIQGGRHMWPGRPLSGNSVPATDLMWAFFMQHPKQ